MHEPESTPEVVAYRLGKIEDALNKLREETITPAIYALHREQDEKRFSRIEGSLAKEADLRGKADESRRTMRLAIALAIVSPILSYLLANFGPSVG